MTRSTTAFSLSDELRCADLGDARLTARLVQTVEALAVSPSASFPNALATEAELEGTYRLLNNRRVTPDDLLAPHFGATAARAGEHAQVRLIHDTTGCLFSGESKRLGLGRVNGADQGFLVHATLAATTGEVPVPLGVLALATWTRSEDKTPKAPHGMSGRHGEFRRWWHQCELAESQLLATTQAVHIMDAEADAYPLLCELSASQHVIRAGQLNRVAYALDEPLATARGSVRELATRAPIVMERTVCLSRRGARGRPKASLKEHPPRDEREARLGVSASRVLLRRSAEHACDLPETLWIHVVRVSEIDPPPDVNPVEWILFTNLSIDTKEDLTEVVDHYRARWLIEEYFKALKTGCSLERRQLESLHALLNALALFVPIAWQMLALRAVERVDPDAPATSILSPRQVRILHSLKHLKMPGAPTVRQALLGVARMGGHLKHNGRPGWRTLSLGMRDLQLIELAWATREEM